MGNDLFAWAAAVSRARGVGPDRRDHNQRWLAFIAERPDVADRVLRWCRAQIEVGERRVSMAKCWEHLRGTVGKGIQLDNSWRAPAARWVVAQDPSLDGLIEMRQRKGGAR